MFTRSFSRRSQASSSAPRLAAQRLIQPQLTIGPVDDPFEREADKVADQVVGRRPAESLLSAPVHLPAGQGEMVRLKATGPSPATVVPNVSPAAEAGIRQAEGGGQPLPAPVRGAMESAFGADFQSVRVHADNRSDHLNHSLGARAFTSGRDIFFRDGEYRPDNAQGQRLLAHELTHVVQQGSRGRRVVQRQEEEEDRKKKQNALTELEEMSEEDENRQT